MQTVKKTAIQRQAAAPGAPPSASAGLMYEDEGYSPAHALQRLLADEWRVGALDDVPRWDPPPALFLSGGISLLLWGAIIWLIAVLL